MVVVPEAVVRAAQRGDEGSLEAWFARGVDPDAGDANGRHLLNHAAEYGHCGAIAVCLRFGCDVNARLPGWAPLHNAAARGREDALAALLAAGADVDAVDLYGTTAVMDAAARGRARAVRRLLAAGARVDTVNGLGRDALACARGFSAPGGAETAALLSAVASAGGWRAYLAAPRKRLLALRALCVSGRASPPAGDALYGALFSDRVPAGVAAVVFAFWRTDRDDSGPGRARARARALSRW